MEYQRSSPNIRSMVPDEEHQAFPELTECSLSQIEGQGVDTPTGEISFSRTMTEVADDDALSQLESQSVDTPTGETSFSRTTTEIADDDFLSRLSIDEFTETSEAQQDVQEAGQVGDMPSGNKPAVKTKKRAKKLLQSVTKWKQDIRYLIGSQIDHQDLKRSLGTITDDMSSVIADCNDERAKLIAVIAKLNAKNSALSFQLRQERSVDPPEQVAIAEAELQNQKKKKRKAPTEYMEDAQCRALTLCGKGSPEPDNIPIPTATRSAGWSSQQLPKTRLPPPLTLENIPPLRQRSVGGDWTDASFEASELKLSHSPTSAELSPDTPTHARGDAKAANKWPKHGTKKRDSIASVSQRLSTDNLAPAPAPAKRRSKKVSTGTKSHHTSEVLEGSTESEPQVRYSTNVFNDTLSPDDLAPPDTIIHGSEEDQGFDLEESDEGGAEEAPNRGPVSRSSSRPSSLNVQRRSRFSSWILDQPIQKLLNMARLGRGGQSLDQELDAAEVDEGPDWGPKSRPSSHYINLKSKRPADRSSYVLYDTTQGLHTPAIDDDGRNIFGQNKRTGGLFIGVSLTIIYIGLLFVTSQVYVASLRQQEIWLNANGLTRKYLLRSCQETPAWMFVPWVDGELVLGIDEAETALSWLWQLLSWNTTNMGYRDSWTYQIDGA